LLNARIKLLRSGLFSPVSAAAPLESVQQKREAGPFAALRAGSSLRARSASARRSRSFAPVGAQDDKRAFASEKKRGESDRSHERSGHGAPAACGNRLMSRILS